MTLAPAGHFYQQKKFQFPIWAIVYLPKLLTATLLRRKKSNSHCLHFKFQ